MSSFIEKSVAQSFSPVAVSTWSFGAVALKESSRVLADNGSAVVCKINKILSEFLENIFALGCR